MGTMSFPCLVGRSGRQFRKREGDGATPIGNFGLLALHFRADRQQRPRSGLKVRTIHMKDAWCDESRHRNYNRQVQLPFAARHERLFRNDTAYDDLVVLSFNIRPRKAYAGSAIFLHLIEPGAKHTEGCIAVSKKHMRIILSHCGPTTAMRVWP